jgi:LysM repeat protein
VRRRLTTALACAAAGLALAAPAHGSNPQIAGLQAALRAHGIYCGAIDGVMGSRTRAALKTFQRRAGLAPDGVPGQRTRRALGPLGHPLFGARTLVRGRFGWDVSVLQFLLAKAGLYDGAIDGFLGPQTQIALRHWQRSAELAADGVAGPRTLTALGGRTGTPLPQPDRPTRTYVVRAGDSFSSIAARYGTTAHAVARANKLRLDTVILIGRRLKIPAHAKAPGLRTSPSSVRDVLTRTAGRYGVDPTLVRALAWMESGYQPHIVSKAGARGVLQLIPASHDFVETVLLGRRLPATVEGDAQAGVLLLRHLLRRFQGNESLALAAWYQGERAVRERGLYPETRLFVADVQALKSRV